jgi:RNA polymerase sigma factor (sigma-70 family)
MSIQDDYDSEISAFYRNYAGKVHGYLVYRGTDWGLAEEIADDAFLAARRHWSHVRSLDRPEAYIFKIARNERSKRQKAHDMRAIELCAEPPELSNHSSSDLGQRIGDRIVLLQAISKLPPCLRDVIILRLIEDFTVEATAEIMGISQGAVKRYTSDGRQRLRSLLTELRNMTEHVKPFDAPAMSSAKIIIAGGSGAGMTTFVGTASEIMPVTTQAVMTSTNPHVADLSYTRDKNTMTVAMDFGRITLEKNLVLYMFGAPGHMRFWYMWDHLIQGAIGAIVLVDTHRFADSFPAVDYFEASGLPFVIAVNGFHGQFPHHPKDVSTALAISPDVPVVTCDARNRESAMATLLTLVEHASSMRPTAHGAPHSRTA